MRTFCLSVVLGTASLGLLVWSAPPGRAEDEHRKEERRKDDRKPPPPADRSPYGTPADRRSGTLYPSGAGTPEGRLMPEYPPTERFRAPYFFPKGAKAERAREVSLYDNYYSPSTLYVPAGTQVRFKNEGRHTHTTTCDWVWESGELGRGESFTLTFTRTGTYYYYCRLHTRWMRGKVVVY
jgi:plastocyanin